MKLFCDLHLHSKYSSATSKFMDLPEMSQYAHLKGVKLLGTGDCLHLKWREHLEATLIRDGPSNLYRLRDGPETLFLPSAEISCEESAAGWSGWKVHLLLVFPSLEEAGAISRSLFRYASDITNGRPTLQIHPSDAVKCVKDACQDAIIIAAHAWTPWFGLYGSRGGFDSIHDAFKDEAKYVDAIETGLSSTPDMSRLLRELDGYPIVSFSDAHSPANIGREATALSVAKLSYHDIKKALSQPLFTIEFFPAEGKYHWDGHRKCGYSCDPHTSRTMGSRCPKCGKRLTIGVQHRVEKLADRKEPEGVPKFHYHVPLVEILSRSFNRKPADQLVQTLYHRYVSTAGNEFKLMYSTPCGELEKIVSERVLESVKRIRSGDVEVTPGYDGVYGEVKLWEESGGEKQMEMF